MKNLFVYKWREKLITVSALIIIILMGILCGFLLGFTIDILGL